MEERYHVPTQNRFYPDKSNVNKNNTVEAKLISPSTCMCVYIYKTNKDVQNDTDISADSILSDDPLY